jgi:hypothetical protein
MWYVYRALSHSPFSQAGSNFYFIAVSEVEAVNAMATGTFVAGSSQDLYALDAILSSDLSL